jgi:adenylate kinase family enzyme
MAKIVEFIGPAGVGKSTVYKELRRQMGLPPQNSRYGLSSIMERISLKCRALGFITHCLKNYPFSTCGEPVKLKSNANSDFLHQVARLIAKEDWPLSRKLRIMEILIKATQDYQTAKEDCQSEWHVFDELFCQRILSVSGRSVDPDFSSKYYVSIMPTTDIVVNFTAPSFDIVSRNLNKDRKSTRSAYKNTNCTQIAIYTNLAQSIIDRILCDILHKGVTLITVDATKKAEQVAKEIKDAFN